MGPAKCGLLLLLAAFAVCQIAAQEKPDFDYFMFVRQWPGTYCSQHACPLVKKHGFRFTIHGLWPNYKDGTWPQFCDNDLPFDEEDIDDILPELEEAWPSYYGTNDNFWAHEWNKHGTCALKEMPSEHKFFKTVLKLHWSLDIAAALRAANILPSDSQTYHGSDISAAIKSLYGAGAIIHCDAEGRLTELWMCINKDFKAVDCNTVSSTPLNDNDSCSRVKIVDWGGSNELPSAQEASGPHELTSSASVSSADGRLTERELELVQPAVEVDVVAEQESGPEHEEHDHEHGHGHGHEMHHGHGEEHHSAGEGDDHHHDDHHHHGHEHGHDEGGEEEKEEEEEEEEGEHAHEHHHDEEEDEEDEEGREHHHHDDDGEDEEEHGGDRDDDGDDDDEDEEHEEGRHSHHDDDDDEEDEEDEDEDDIIQQQQASSSGKAGCRKAMLRGSSSSGSLDQQQQSGSWLTLTPSSSPKRCKLAALLAKLSAPFGCRQVMAMGAGLAFLACVLVVCLVQRVLRRRQQLREQQQQQVVEGVPARPFERLRQALLPVYGNEQLAKPLLG